MLCIYILPDNNLICLTFRVMDQASRQRRARKKLESLEQDNFHDDPHADLVRILKK